jgi:hypothetical protein
VRLPGQVLVRPVYSIPLAELRDKDPSDSIHPFELRVPKPNPLPVANCTQKELQRREALAKSIFYAYR